MLCSNGELCISGSGVVQIWDEGFEDVFTPWQGDYHALERCEQEGEENRVKYNDWELGNYCQQNISKIVFGEGITGVGNSVFYNMPKVENVQFSTTINNIANNAFLLTPWILYLYDTVPGYYYNETQSYVVDVVVNGITFNLHANENW